MHKTASSASLVLEICPQFNNSYLNQFSSVSGGNCIKFKEGETAATPAGEDLFGQKSSNDKKLQQDKAEAFHTTVAQGLFLTKRGRPDIHTGIAFLCTRVQQPNEEDWEKLVQKNWC